MKLSPAILLLALQPSLGNATEEEEMALSPPNSPPSKKHAHHKAGGFVSRIAENGLTNAGCCVADGIDSASARMADAAVLGAVFGCGILGCSTIVCSILKN